MVEFKKYIGPHGIPVYHQSLPMVESVAIHWMIFTGGADDATVGTDGAHHWFEHVPFRGTVDFPTSMAIDGPFLPRSGVVNAWTNPVATCFWAYVHESQAELALHVITDLWSRPLMTEESIEAERKIIFEEIRKKNSQLAGSVFYQLPRLLWPGHPLGHSVLGSLESLSKLDAATLRKAHEHGYAASRAVLFASGNDKAVHDALEKVSAVIPQTKLSERRAPAQYGALPAWQGGTTEEIATDFPSSLVLTLFPTPKISSPKEQAIWDMAGSMLSYGGMASPLSQIVRVKHQLAYDTDTFGLDYPDGGFSGIEIETSAEKIPQAHQALAEVFADPRIRSQERFEEILTGYQYSRRMRPIDPGDYNVSAYRSLLNFGQVMSDAEIEEMYQSITLKDVVAALDRCTPNLARTIIFKGNGKAS